MTKTDDPAVRPSETHTELKETPTDSTSASSGGIPQKGAFIMLSDYVLDMPAKVRLPVHNRVTSAVKNGEIFGLIHPTDHVDILILDSKNNEVARSFKQVLVSRSAAMQERLEQISTTAVVEEVIRTGGRNFSIEELAAMGEDLDFDVMAAAARKRELARIKARTAKNRKKPNITT